jgi:hypothetical protein
MAEVDIEMGEFYSFVEGKGGDLCRVRSCRNPHAPARTLCYKHHMKLWRARNPMRATYNNVKGKAKQRKIAFSLTFDEFVSICEASGYIEGKGHAPDDLSLDRVDPNKGYEFDNIAVITISENSSKGSYERWVTTKDGRRVRIYQIGVQTDAQVEERQTEEDYVPDFMYGLDQGPKFSPTENEPF